MLDVERPVGVSRDPGQTVLEDDFHYLVVMAKVADPFVVQILYNFHGLYLLSFSLPLPK